jgi:hypothetical protein
VYYDTYRKPHVPGTPLTLRECVEYRRLYRYWNDTMLRCLRRALATGQVEQVAFEHWRALVDEQEGIDAREAGWWDAWLSALVAKARARVAKAEARREARAAAAAKKAEQLQALVEQQRDWPARLEEAYQAAYAKWLRGRRIAWGRERRRQEREEAEYREGMERPYHPRFVGTCRRFLAGHLTGKIYVSPRGYLDGSRIHVNVVPT